MNNLNKQIEDLRIEKDEIENKAKGEIEQLQSQYDNILKRHKMSVSESREKEKEMKGVIHQKDLEIEALLKEIEWMKANPLTLLNNESVDKSSKNLHTHRYSRDQSGKNLKLNGSQNTSLLNNDLLGLHHHSTSKNKSKSKNSWDMLKSIKFRFRALPNNFYIDEENLSLCLFDQLQDTVEGKKKPIINKETKRSCRNLLLSRKDQKSNVNPSTCNRFFSHHQKMNTLNLTE